MGSKPKPKGENVAPDVGQLCQLSERQQSALEAASRVGYFDVPRGGTLGDVADDLGIARASASELVRRALRELVGAHIDNQDSE